MSLYAAIPPSPRAVHQPLALERPALVGRRILLADPDRIFMLGLVQHFEHEGLQVCRCDDLPHLLNRLANASWDVLVLDPAIAGAAATSLFGEIARLPSPPALIVASPAMHEIDRIVALEMGADHCVPKPCSPAEMLARVRALLGRRRTASAASPSGGTATFADLWFDPQRRVLRRSDGGQQRLSAAESDLLTLFLRNPRRVLSREELLAGTAAVLGSDRSLRAIDVLVSRLRAELTAAVPIIVTMRGQGYIMPHPVLWD